VTLEARTALSELTLTLTLGALARLPSERGAVTLEARTALSELDRAVQHAVVADTRTPLAPARPTTTDSR